MGFWDALSIFALTLNLHFRNWPWVNAFSSKWLTSGVHYDGWAGLGKEAGTRLVRLLLVTRNKQIITLHWYSRIGPGNFCTLIILFVCFWTYFCCLLTYFWHFCESSPVHFSPMISFIPISSTTEGRERKGMLLRCLLIENSCNLWQTDQHIP